MNSLKRALRSCGLLLFFVVQLPFESSRVWATPSQDDAGVIEDCSFCVGRADGRQSLTVKDSTPAPSGHVRQSDQHAVAMAGLNLDWILDTTPYPPRWYCGKWSASIGWLHILSDLMTWLAYVIIPIMLIYFARKREEFPFNGLFWLFGAFILFCGTTHLMEAIIFWWPAYGLSGVIKLGTAIVSLATVVALRKAIPQALAFRSPQQLENEVQIATKASEVARQRAIRIIEASPVSMIRIDRGGIIRLTNQATVDLFGYTREELLGSSVEMLVPASVRQQHKEHREEFCKNPTSRHMALGRELFGLHRSGEQIPIEISLNPVDTIEGSDVLCSILDLQERKRAARKLQRHATQLAKANEDLDRFAYVASHDLKSPLRAIDNLSKWLLKDCGNELPEESHRHLQQLRGRVGRMERLLDDLLSYSRVGRTADEAESIDSRVLIHEALDTLDIPESFSVEVLVECPSIQGRKTALRQVMMNLVSNAIKHHDREDGRISIQAKDDGENVEFIIEDDGPGISPEFHERAFQPFQTLQSRDKIEGTGLGLSIVQRLIEQEGGTIELVSDAGEGCRFRVRWPIQCAICEQTLQHA